MTDELLNADSGDETDGGMPDKTPAKETPKAPAKTAAKEPEDWRSGFAEGLDDDTSTAWGNISSRYQTKQDFAKGLVEKEKALRTRVPLPKEDASEDEWNELYSKLGRPEKPDAYQLNWPKDAPPLSEGEVTAFEEYKAVHFRNGGTQKQLDEQVKWEATHRKLIADAEMAKASDLTHENVTAIKTEWGSDFKQNVEIYGNTFQAYAREDYDKLKDARLADGTTLGNNPAFARMMVRIGRERVNDDWDVNPINAQRKTNAQEELQAKLKELGNRGIRPGHPDYPGEEMEDLYKRAGSTRRQAPNDRFSQRK